MDLFPLFLTIKVSFFATVLTIAIGLTLAWVMAKRDFWGKGLLDVIIMQPLVIPPTVLGYYLLALFVRPARAALEGVGADLENAARLLGKTEWQVIRTITLPLAWRGILAGAVMAFARATGEFRATLMVAGDIPGVTQTLPIAIYDAVQSGDSGAANLLVLIITLFSFSVLFAAGKIGRGRL